MNYMGGKHRQGPTIAKFVKEVIKPDQIYVEPFCGAMGVAYRVNHTRMILSDVSEPLINMWKFLLENPNFELPEVITENEYQEVKSKKDPKDWRTAYIGFGMSFGSKYWGGYARNGRGTNYAVDLARSTSLKRSTLLSIGVELFNCGYGELVIPDNSVVYLDPPYQNRTKAHDFGEFNHCDFWEWARGLVKKGHIVLATEFIVPDDFIVIHDFKDTVVRHHSSVTKGDGTSEVLVCHESQKQLWGAE